MISTYVYGTPHGFNFYEGVASLNDYFKGFYISTRRGQRLMVNRRDDGCTIYSFLCYGLMENEGRPNAFFGFSVVLNDYEYSPDLKIIFEYFDYLFNHIIERGHLFAVNESGTLQYKIDRFSDISEEIDWLKSNLPNLFASSRISLSYYDNTFSKQNLGKVVCCNIDTPANKIVSNLKKVHWIAISPKFEPEKEVVEINLSELDAKLNNYNQEILPIAINPSKDNLTWLQTIQADCKDIITSLSDHASTTYNETERQNCHEIIRKYYKLSDTLTTLISRVSSIDDTTTEPDPKPTKKYCKKCRKWLPIEKFSDKDSEICIDCLQPKETKHCKICQKDKDASCFTNGDDICAECRHKIENKPSWYDSFKPSHVAAIAVIVVVLCAVLFIKSFSGDEVEKTVLNNDDKVAAELFDGQYVDSLINDGNLNEALVYIKSPEYKKTYNDSITYINKIKSSIDKKISDILQSTTMEFAQKWVEFKVSNQQIITNLEYDTKSYDDYAEVCGKLANISKKQKLSENEKKTALELISSLPLNMRNTWRDLTNKIQSEQRVANNDNLRHNDNLRQEEVKANNTSKTAKFMVIDTGKADTATPSIQNFTISSDTTLYYASEYYVMIVSRDEVKCRTTDYKVEQKSNGFKIRVPKDDKTVVFDINGIKIKIRKDKK